MVTSLVPMWLVALQTYWPESWRPTLGKTRLLSTILCLQGREDRSLDHVMVGFGNPLGKIQALKHTLLYRYINVCLGFNPHNFLLLLTVAPTMGITMKCGSWSFYHNNHRLTDAGTWNSWHLRPSFYEHLYTSLSCALVVLCCAHVCATVFWPSN